uniref:Uncharacterized protein n=1 Tax=Cucumis melo TaxID=3656 RepID=A0A9I9DUS8_CUCME
YCLLHSIYLKNSLIGYRSFLILCLATIRVLSMVSIKRKKPSESPFLILLVEPFLRLPCFSSSWQHELPMASDGRWTTIGQSLNRSGVEQIWARDDRWCGFGRWLGFVDYGADYCRRQ